MTIEEQLLERSGKRCEICGSADGLQIYEITQVKNPSVDNSVLICEMCFNQVTRKTEINQNHWSVLKDSMWSDIPSIQILSWRMLSRLSNETWASEALDMLYLDDEILKIARSGDHENGQPDEKHKDSNGAELINGDSVVLTKSLDVKGSQLNARIGTVVKNIKLVHDNNEQIEGKIEGQQIVILTKYVRKQLS
jgi:protein PhnA